MSILPSWNPTPIREAILDFVAAVTNPDSDTFVPQSQRIATFDNDGTLWCEQPLQIQGFFLIDRIHDLATAKPEIQEQQPFKAILERDRETISTFGKKELITLFFATHTGMSPDDFQAIAKPWLNSATHPRFQHLFKACIYQPMRELLDYLAANGFKNYIVSAGGIDFMRVVSDEIYGIPSEQVIGSSSKTQVEFDGDVPVVMKLPELNSFNDRAAKVENIALHIGQRPLLAFGNSDGDLAMLQYTAAGTGKRLALLLHHDDAEREYAYDRDFKLSPLIEGLDVVPKLNGGIVVSMKENWNHIFAF